MNEQTKTADHLHPAFALAIATGPVTVALIQILFGSAPWSTLWIGLGVAVVAFVLVRFLSGFALFGHRRLVFGAARRLHVWQAPALWVPVVLAASMLAFWWFAA